MSNRKRSASHPQYHPPRREAPKHESYQFPSDPPESREVRLEILTRELFPIWSLRNGRTVQILDWSQHGYRYEVLTNLGSVMIPVSHIQSPNLVNRAFVQQVGNGINPDLCDGAYGGRVRWTRQILQFLLDTVRVVSEPDPANPPGKSRGRRER